MNNDKYVLIVDPFSSGAAFADRVKFLYGYNVIALITNHHLPPAVMATFRSEEYLKVFVYKSLHETVLEIESFLGRAPDYIVCGSEPGVLVFDLLCQQWDLLPNVFELSQARRDKSQMQRQLMTDKVKHIPHFKSGVLEDILQWCADNPFNEYVIKPLSSFGTDGVFFCKNIHEVESAFNSLINTRDYSGIENKELLIEQKIEGTEYVVDAVSSYGKHFVVNIFRYVKQEVNGVPIYSQMITEPVNEHPELITYISSVLTSLGIRNGTSHNEVILSTDGPVLVETGARMHGGLGPRLVEACNTHSLIDLSLMARIAPLEFTDKTFSLPVLKKYAIECFLKAPCSGTVAKVDVESKCSSLDSYGFTVCKYIHGDQIEKTVDLVTSYGRVVLFNADKHQLESDAKKIVEWDEAGKLITISP
ncbi:ATP-grasp domain-containing protein [Enterobacter asburiae]|uniref:ATP-grasp domain-containing protein n=1 Tax=Enterobacter asburiae TaxID=61645 RepID=UPI00192B3AD1|nr:ATP-grasp domain-containing protein [Enterobacter asburiae]MBL5841303.1 ATP-grasp domain-containing protein [Enterobacter asburiae]MBL5941697.1 ATP-grasp domain-containing protein [Enterobacter asburiae]MBL5963621.1 ATP-grasp domain-containing protein [Enterobacter asburiae]MBL5972103.1 ATP-grasp domain-containing protein [Enterobacter asburiae]